MQNARLTSSGHHLTVRAQAAVENSALMGRDFNVLDQSWVAPEADGVVGEATGTGNLLVLAAPSEGGNLRAGVDAVDTSTSGGVPEVNVSVVGSTTSSEEVWLPWAPAKSLDSSTVVGLGELGSIERAGVPDGDEVVVATGSKLSAICAPLEATNLTNVVVELSDLVLSDANVVVEDET